MIVKDLSTVCINLARFTLIDFIFRIILSLFIYQSATVRRSSSRHQCFKIYSVFSRNKCCVAFSVRLSPRHFIKPVSRIIVGQHSKMVDFRFAPLKSVYFISIISDFMYMRYENPTTALCTHRFQHL